MADDREAGKNRRMKDLEDHPVADDMFDIVRHHGKHGGEEKVSVVAVAKSGKSHRAR